MRTNLVDLAQAMPEELHRSLGELTVLFGRLEHMVLLAIKRERSISLVEAQQLYKGYSLGSKLFGKQPCKNVSTGCQNQDGEIGLLELAGDNKVLKKICIEIQKITSERNRLIHGLITTVGDASIVFHNKKTYTVQEETLWDMKDKLIEIITRLNREIPIPGLHAGWVTGPDLDVSYDETALASDDPLVSVVGNVEKE